MLTERFVEFLKTEWNDFMGVYEEKPSVNSSPKKPSEESLFEQFFSFFTGGSPQKASEADRQKAYEAYQQYRQSQKQTTDNQVNMQKIQEAKYFDALEIKATLNFEEIKIAYKKAMKKYHPDRYAGDMEKQKIAQILSQKINEAYQYFEKKHQK